MLRTLRALPLKSQIAVYLLSAGVVLCLVAGATNFARAALEYQSDKYVAEIQQTHIGVALTEQTGAEAEPRVVSGENQLIQDLALLCGTDEGANPEIAFDTPYDERLSALNVSEDRDEYVRLTVRKYWAEGANPSEAQKVSHLNPAHIVLGFDEASTGDWVYSAEESSAERLVFYYKKLLRAGEAAETPAVTTLSVSSDLAEAAAVKGTAEDYSNCWIALSAQVDSVQSRNAVAAAQSAWGIDVTQFADLGLDWSGE